MDNGQAQPRSAGAYDYDDINTLKDLLDKNKPPSEDLWPKILDRIHKRHFYRAGGSKKISVRIVACKHCGFLVCKGGDVFRRRQARHMLRHDGVRHGAIGKPLFEEYLQEKYKGALERVFNEDLTPLELENASWDKRTARPPDHELMSEEEEEEPQAQTHRRHSPKRFALETKTQFASEWSTGSTTVSSQTPPKVTPNFQIRSSNYDDPVHLKKAFVHYARQRQAESKSGQKPTVGPHFLTPLRRKHFTGYQGEFGQRRSRDKYVACMHCGLHFGNWVSHEKARHLLVCTKFPHFTWKKDVKYREDMTWEEKERASGVWHNQRTDESTADVSDAVLASLVVRRNNP